MKMNFFCVSLLLIILLSSSAAEINITPIGLGWARNSINTVIFRRNSVVTHEQTQYVAYYDADSHVVLAKRNLNNQTWETKTTQYKGNTRDAHNSISIMVDGSGILHMSWDHHGHELRYCRSKEPGSLELTEKMPMTGKKENKVTYPEFYRLPNGNLLFLYRDGSSGRGDLMMNHYNYKTQTWSQRQDAFINGEDERNAYWQMCTDNNGAIHISWVWRESGDVASNHDICYAKSLDEGKTWLKSNGEQYTLPITAENAEYAARIPMSSELINTTSMSANDKSNPYIATYWRPQGSDVPQYHLVFHDGKDWNIRQITNRETPFSIKGGGTRRISISRCQIVVDSQENMDVAYMLFRDVERDNRLSVAISENAQLSGWRFEDLTDFSLGMWEPSYDTEMWKREKKLHVFIQKVGQGDGESIEDIPPQTVSILEWNIE
ncbi:MAG: BNR repeat-containing protein [Candidatus Hinthialibacter antarcticus]|nr:BNR repeat-containing protein [Candidatus Hinthialibacter antarcticus]